MLRLASAEGATARLRFRSVDRTCLFTRGHVPASVAAICTVEALVDGVDSHETNLVYSGDVSQLRVDGVDGCTVQYHQPQWPLSSSIFAVKYRFERALSKGEVHRFVYRISVEDNAYEPQPFLYWSVYHPTELVTQRVQFAPDAVPDHVSTFVTLGPERIAHALPSVDDLVPDDRLVSFSVSKPEIGRTYGLRWVWPAAYAVAG